MGQRFGAVILVGIEEFQNLFCIVDGVLISLRTGSDEPGIRELRSMVEGDVEGKGSRQADGQCPVFFPRSLSGKAAPLPSIWRWSLRKWKGAHGR